MSSGEQQLLEVLLQCCDLGDPHTLQQVVREYPDIDYNITTEGGVTLLMHAIIGAGTNNNPNGLYMETCQVLIQQCHVALETPDVNHGRTAAHWATYYHRHDILGELIIAGADMTCPDFSGTSPFHLAIQESANDCLYQTLRFLPKQILEIPDAQSRLPLSLAVQLGNTEAIQMLVEAGADLNSLDESTGRTPLHYAVELGDLGTDVVQFLIKSGALFDVYDSAGLTPIHLAAIVESKEPLVAIAKMVGGGEILDQPDLRGLTPLMYACVYGNEETVKFLVKKKANLLAQDQAEGKLCIHYAAESAHVAAPDIVQFLCKKQADLLEAKDGYGRTPLHSCAKAGSVETFQVLMVLNTSLTSTDSEGRNAVYWATVSGNHVVLTSLLDAGCPADSADSHGAYPLHYAVQQTKEPSPADVEEYTEEGLAYCQNVQQCVTILIERGVSVDCRDAQGLTPFHWALQLPNNLTVCFKLLENGADPIAKDNDNMSALHVAARRGLTENCQFLLEHTGSGHYVNETDVHGQTALHHAVSCDGVECVEYLLNSGLPANQPDEELRTPAHLAATIGSVQCLQTLHAYGANFSLKSKYGATPLHEAAANGKADALEFIISVRGEEGSLDEPADGGATSLHYAVAGGHEDCVRVLLQFGANVNSITEGTSLTPLDYCSEENADLADLLKSFGGLGGEAVVEQLREAAALEGSTSSPTEQPDDKHDEDVLEEKSPQVSRPTTRPSSRISVESPKFEVEPVATPTDGATTPRRPELPTPDIKEPKRVGLLERAMSVLKRSRSPAPPESILSSAIGFYAAHATMLTAAIIGTPLGDKTLEIAQKVATDTAEELKKSAAALDGEIPDLIWLREKVETPRTPTPVVEKVATPPPPPTPPPPEVKEDPYERRLRKARAQMDMSKSAAFLAVEELIKAQETHMRLKRQFQEAKLEEDIKTRKEVFHAEEAVAREASEKVMRRFAERMNKAESESEKVNDVIEQRLKAAHEENAKLTQLMSSMGINPRPTVAEWIKQKNNQKKTTVQEALINWDRGKQTRETAILLQQTITSQRAMKHAAWEAKKDISSKLKELKSGQQQPKSRQTILRNTYKQRVKVPAAPKRTKATGKLKAPAAYHIQQQQRMAAVAKEASLRSRQTKASTGMVPGTVRATPSGFLKMRDTPAHDKGFHDDDDASERRRLQQRQEEMWRMGQRYIDGEFTGYKRSCPPSEEYLRATGPKDIHAERTLFFYHPEQYKTVKSAQKTLEKQLSQQLGLSPTRSSLNRRRRGNSASSITIRSLDFTSKKVSTKGQRSATTGHGPQFHSLADSIGRRPKRSKSTPETPVEVLPMTILDPNQVPTAVAT